MSVSSEWIQQFSHWLSNAQITHIEVQWTYPYKSKNYYFPVINHDLANALRVDITLDEDYLVVCGDNGLEVVYEQMTSLNWYYLSTKNKNYLRSLFWQKIDFKVKNQIKDLTQKLGPVNLAKVNYLGKSLIRYTTECSSVEELVQVLNRNHSRIDLTTFSDQEIELSLNFFKNHQVLEL